MNYGYVLKRNNEDYVVLIDPNTYEGGYNVVPKSVDPYNAYELADVIAYYNANPDKQIDLALVQEMETNKRQFQEYSQNLIDINYELFNRMVQKVFNPETSMQEEYVPTTEELLATKAQLEQNIEQLKQSLNL